MLDKPQTLQGRPKRSRRGADKNECPVQTTNSASMGSSQAIPANGAGEVKSKSSAIKAKNSPRPIQAPRVTRAQRRLLNGKDAELVQLGQRGEVDVQGKSGLDASKNASKDVTGERRRSAKAGTMTNTKVSLKEDSKRGRKAGQGRVGKSRA